MQEKMRKIKETLKKMRALSSQKGRKYLSAIG